LKALAPKIKDSRRLKNTPLGEESSLKPQMVKSVLEFELCASAIKKLKDRRKGEKSHTNVRNVSMYLVKSKCIEDIATKTGTFVVPRAKFEIQNLKAANFTQWSNFVLLH